MSLAGILVGMGNPLLDISAEVDEAMLTKYDLKLDNAILAEEKHVPIYKDLVDNFKVQYIAGGATQSSIRVAQWMIGEAGATTFMGCIGADQFGSDLKASCEADGVTTHYMVDAETPTGTCAVLVSGGERSLIANLASANNFKESHLETPEAKAIIEKAQFFYSAGFFLTVSVESLVKTAQHAVDNSKTFLLNLSAPFIIDFFGDQVAAAIPFADYIFANESEAAAYGKKHNLGEDPKEVALKLCNMAKVSGVRGRTVVFTQGSGATIVARNGVATEYAVEPLAKELLVDTNGAGDAFVGGFLAQLVKEKDIAECVRAGHWAAKEVIQQSGCQFPKVCTYA
jgi:adenosine kinase